MKEDNKDFIDELARKALGGYQVDLNPADWDLLERKLDKKPTQRRFFPPFFIRGLQLGLLLFSSIGLWAYWSGDFSLFSFLNGEQQGRTGAKAEQQSEDEKLQNTEEQDGKSKKTVAELLDAEQYNEQPPSSSARAEEQDLPSPKKAAGKKAQGKNKENIARSKKYTTASSSSTPGDDSLLAKEQKAEKLAQEAKTKLEELDALAKASNALQTDGEEETLLASNELLPNGFPKFLKTAKKEGPGFGLKRLNPQMDYFTQSRWGLSLGTHIGQNSSAGRNRMGYQISGFYELEFSKDWSLNIGAAFYFLRFEQNETSLFEDPNNEGLFYSLRSQSQSNMQVLQVPVALQYCLFRDEKWRILAQTGMSFGLVLGQQTEGSWESDLQQSNGQMQIRTDMNGSQLDGGVAQQGFAASAIPSVLLGLSIERQLSDDFILFVQPLGQYDLKGLGQAKDKMHIFSLHVGLKTSLR